MNQIKLLDKSDTAAIRKVVANREALTRRGYVNIPDWVAYQGEGTTKPATKRATCRLCGEKIKEGLQLSFFFDEEQNSWTSKEYHVHADGCPNNTREMRHNLADQLVPVLSRIRRQRYGEHSHALSDNQKARNEIQDRIATSIYNRLAK